MKRKLTENYKRVEERIAAACERAERRRDQVNLITVTKYVSLDVIRTLVELGVQDLAESHVQELTKRAGMADEWLSRRARDPSSDAKFRPQWHMIGHLQRNKVKALLPWVHLVHSVDSLRLAEEINTLSAKLNRVTPILIQVNAGGESGKFGVAVAAVTHLAEQFMSLENVEVQGLMAMAPLSDDESVVRPVFQRTRELFDEITTDRICGDAFCFLSMGMSNDFEIAIEYGATHVRIGSAVFEGIELAPEAVHSQ